MSERREPGFNFDQLSDSVPTLETPAVVRQQPARNSAKQSQSPAAAKSSTRGSTLLWLLVLVLMAGILGLGFWGLQLQQKMQQQSVLLEQMNLWLESTDATLSQTSTTASKSGETLAGRLDQLSGRLDERIKHFDSEIAKLWTVAYQRNKPQLEAQAKQLEAQQASLTEQDARLQSLTASVESQLAGISAAVAQLTSLKDSVATVQTQLSKIEASQTSAAESIVTNTDRQTQLASDVELQFSFERDERARLAADLNAKLEQLRNADQSDRLTDLEARLNGIDASRQSLTTELLKLQKQVNSALLERSAR